MLSFVQLTFFFWAATLYQALNSLIWAGGSIEWGLGTPGSGFIVHMGSTSRGHARHSVTCCRCERQRHLHECAQ